MLSTLAKQFALDSSMRVILSGQRATTGGAHTHDMVLNVAPGIVAAQFVSASLTRLPGYELFRGQVAWVHTQVVLLNVFPRLLHLASASVKDTVW